jgi:long-chain acyl-CoA synthetase
MPDAGTTLITTPLYHAFGNGVLSASLARGLSVVMAGRFDPLGTLEAIERHRITATPMVPTQFLRLLKLDDADRTRFDLSSLEWILHTAAPCPAWAKVAMIEWLGPVIYEMYGSSEGTGPTICDSHEWLAHPGTVGKASSRIEYSIVDDDGNDLPPGEVGTIYCRRSDGAPEYHGDPDKTASIQLPDGRFTVGDLGWLDDDGYLYLADRRVDLILVAGSNVYPAEIEAVLSEHPSVADVAVFGIPDPEWGEQVKAVIEPAGEVDLDDVRRFAADRLASYKLPKSYDVVDRLPREAHGKLKKRLLRDPYWAGER